MRIFLVYQLRLVTDLPTPLPFTFVRAFKSFERAAEFACSCEETTGPGLAFCIERVEVFP